MQKQANENMNNGVNSWIRAVSDSDWIYELIDYKV